MNFMRRYVALVDGFNYRLGRIMIYGIFALMAVLAWSTLSKVAFTPSLWTLEMAQFVMVGYYMLGGPYSIQMGTNVRMDPICLPVRRRAQRLGLAALYVAGQGGDVHRDHADAASGPVRAVQGHSFPADGRTPRRQGRTGGLRCRMN